VEPSRLEGLTLTDSRNKFEENNSTFQDLGLVQALMLLQDVALWSGNRRKMEIAECHQLIPITVRSARRIGCLDRSY